MIGHAKKFIFTHIPRTGGTSISQLLARYGIALQGSENYDSIYFKHVAAASMKRMLGEEYDKYFKFAFVRNPWDWLVSNYEYNRGLHRPFVKDTGHAVSGKVPEWARGMSFSEWLVWWTDTFSPSQSAMLTDSNGEILMDAIYRFELLTSDFKKLKRRLGIWTWSFRLPHLQSSKGRAGYRSYYDDRSVKVVRERFSMDLQLLGYPAEP
jgi:hypothetical protein